MRVVSDEEAQAFRARARAATGRKPSTPAYWAAKAAMDDPGTWIFAPGLHGKSFSSSYRRARDLGYRLQVYTVDGGALVTAERAVEG